MNSADVAALQHFLATDHNNVRLDLIALGWDNPVAGAGGIAQYDFVYISASNTILKADADTLITSKVFGIAMETKAAGNATWVNCSDGGIITNAGWALTAGQDVYLSTVAGELTQDVGSLIRAGKIIVKLGIAITATKIKMRIESPTQSGI